MKDEDRVRDALLGARLGVRISDAPGLVEALDTVVHIGFDVRLASGRRIEFISVRKEKIAELLTATDELGSWLRALVLEATKQRKGPS